MTDGGIAESPGEYVPAIKYILKRLESLHAIAAKDERAASQTAQAFLSQSSTFHAMRSI
jgi:hypothetical protein